jgi:hypothetical protein
MVVVATQLAKREGVSEKGYRLVINSGRQGGSSCLICTCTLLGVASYRTH